MPKRSEQKEAAKAEYIARRSKGEKVNLKELAEQVGVSYSNLRNWKAREKWDEQIPKKRRGAQRGNRNAAGHKNAAGSHDGAPIGNKNAEKDGAYSTIFFDMLSDAEKELAAITPLGSRAALEHEMQILKVREHRIMAKISEYEAAPEDVLYINTVLDMREPVKGKDGAKQQMGMYNKDSAFARAMKLQEALYKVQGRIAAVANSLRSLEEYEQKMTIESQKLEILRMRATGEVEIEDPAAGEGVELEDELAADTAPETEAVATSQRKAKRKRPGSRIEDGK